MPKYEIQRWDPVIPKGKNDEPYPMVYIKPSEDFFDYMKENNFLFLVTITDTESRYDGKQILAMSDLSAYFPNYRPNFFNDTGYYTLLLFSNWLGYPKINGNVFIQGLKGPDSIVPETKPYTAPVPLEWYQPRPPIRKEEDSENSFSFYGLGSILFAIIAIIVVMVIMSRK